ncbi:MAG: fumarylacetoacetate hydrolase family protein [Hyphomonadaceae bacterium]
MKLARLRYDGSVRYGIVDGDDVALADIAAPPDSLGVLGLLSLDSAALSNGLRAWPRVALADVELLAPVGRPGKILAIALNYREHASETGQDVPKVQKWFNKQTTAVNAPFAPVDMPAVSTALDYEAEVVVVIGKPGRHVPRERAMEIVAGFACGCDYSVRDWQRASPTMIMGKGFDTHAPFGPWLTTPDEVGAIEDLGVRCLVNGEQRQSGSAGDMIFDIGAQIEHLTKAFTLEPGDLLFTGTPPGVGVARTPPAFLKVGDRVRVEVDRLGAIEAEITPEDATTRIG